MYVDASGCRAWLTGSSQNAYLVFEGRLISSESYGNIVAALNQNLRQLTQVSLRTTFGMKFSDDILFVLDSDLRFGIAVWRTMSAREDSSMLQAVDLFQTLVTGAAQEVETVLRAVDKSAKLVCDSISPRRVAEL